MSLSVPSDDLCMRYAAGVLDPALRLLLDLHLARSPATQARIDAFVAFGGLALAAETPLAMTAGALDIALTRIAREPARRPAAPPPGPHLPDLHWRWAGPGCRIARFSVDGSQLKTFAIKVGPGAAMLDHGHEGDEWTLVVEGAYHDERGRFEAGSFIEEDETSHHRPVADAEVGCVCLFAMAGDLTASGLSGAVARWMLR